MTNQVRDAAYAPPHDVRAIPLASLLGRGPREPVSEHQLSFLGPAGLTTDEIKVFVAGDVELLNAVRSVSIIGTRKVSANGARRASRLARELVENDVVIVSGLAEGIDTTAMESAIRSGGRTVGVIGTPLDQVYPAKNRELQEIIYRDYLLVSQFTAGSKVMPANFPRRNRLMAMLSDATVIVEASDTSGTLHQAAECVRLNRWLFIAKNVVDNPVLSWPARFINYERFRVLERTDDLMSLVYGKC